MKKEKIIIILIVMVLVGGFFRFYNLNWGSPFYFHPDERNFATSITRLHFPERLNPNFFAYGSLPIYTIYATGVVSNLISHLLNPQIQQVVEYNSPRPQTWSIFTVSFQNAIIISRFYSAYFSTLFILLLFFAAKKVYVIEGNKKHKTKADSNRLGLLTAFLAATSVGFIQYAHFGTFEIWLTFFSVLLFWLCLKILESSRLLYEILAAIVFGALIAIKFSCIVLLPPLLVLLVLKNIHKKNNNSKSLLLKSEIQYLNLVKRIILFLCVSGIIFLATNPFILLDFKSFIQRLQYESAVAIGTIPAFYTGEFINTTPVIFQFIHVYPFIMNPLLTCFFIPSFIYLIFYVLKKRNKKYILLIIFFLILFISNAFLYVKWTRYLIPTLPFVYLIIVIALLDYWKSITKKNILFTIKNLIFIVFIIINILFAVSFFITVYFKEDTRITAINFAKQNIAPLSMILGEEYDFGLAPFDDPYPGLKLFNFYSLDNSSLNSATITLEQQLATSEYVVLPSQRILKTRLQDPKSFPIGHSFYSQLFTGKNGFRKIYESPCDLFCRITYLNNPIYSFEETANVFDRPTVFIFKKQK